MAIKHNHRRRWFKKIIFFFYFTEKNTQIIWLALYLNDFFPALFDNHRSRISNKLRNIWLDIEFCVRVRLGICSLLIIFFFFILYLITLVINVCFHIYLCVCVYYLLKWCFDWIENFVNKSKFPLRHNHQYTFRITLVIKSFGSNVFQRT